MRGPGRLNVALQRQAHHLLDLAADEMGGHTDNAKPAH